MTVEQRRMYQRRGLYADLPSVPNDGEIYVTLDTREVFMGIGGNLVKLMVNGDVIDDLLSDNSNIPLSANQGRILKGKIDSLENFVILYKEQIDDILSDYKQNVHYGADEPSSLDLIWYDNDE